MKAGKNFIVVKTMTQKNNEIKSGDFSLLLNTTFNPHHHAKIEAEVFASPIEGSNLEVAWKYFGMPSSKQKLAKLASDFDYDIKVGDKVYFHYLGLDQANFIRHEDDAMLFWLPLDDVFCVVRDNNIIPLFGYTFVSPVTDESIKNTKVESSYGTWGVRASLDTGTGLLLKKKDETLIQQGVIKHLGEDEGFIDVDVKEGDKVLYMADNEFENNIEGEDFYVMKKWEIFAKFQGDEVIPLADYVTVSLDEEKSHPILKLKPKPQTSGVINKVGPGAHGLEVGDRIKFVKSAMYISHESTSEVFLPESDIIGVYKLT